MRLPLKPPNWPPCFHSNPTIIHSSFSGLMISQILMTDHANSTLLTKCSKGFLLHLKFKNPTFLSWSLRSYVNLGPAYLSELTSNYLTALQPVSFFFFKLTKQIPILLATPCQKHSFSRFVHGWTLIFIQIEAQMSERPSPSES